MSTSSMNVPRHTATRAHHLLPDCAVVAAAAVPACWAAASAFSSLMMVPPKAELVRGHEPIGHPGIYPGSRATTLGARRLAGVTGSRHARPELGAFLRRVSAVLAAAGAAPGGHRD